MLYCGDDAEAKKKAATLATDLGFERVHAGALPVARLLVPLAMLWITLAFKQGMGVDFGFRLARRFVPRKLIRTKERYPRKQARGRVSIFTAELRALAL